jgi:hypothetical protein
MALQRADSFGDGDLPFFVGQEAEGAADTATAGLAQAKTSAEAVVSTETVLDAVGLLQRARSFKAMGGGQLREERDGAVVAVMGQLGVARSVAEKMCAAFHFDMAEMLDAWASDPLGVLETIGVDPSTVAVGVNGVFKEGAHVIVCGLQDSLLYEGCKAQVVRYEFAVALAQLALQTTSP